MGQIELKSYTFVSLLDTAFKLYRRNFHLFFWLSAIFFLIPFFAQRVVEIRMMGRGDMFERFITMFGYMTGESLPNQPSYMESDQSMALFGLQSCLGFLVLLIYPFSAGPMVNAIHRTGLSGACSFGEAFKIGGSRYLNLFASTILFGLIITALCLPIFIVMMILGIIGQGNPAAGCAYLGICVSFPVLFVVIIYVYVLFSLYSQAIVIERKGPWEALARSASLIKGYWWRVVGIMIVINLVESFIILFSQSSFYAVGGLIDEYRPSLEILSDTVVAAGLTVVMVFTQPILLLAQTLLFYDLKVRREAYDLERNIEHF